jgi:hypothetical protein
MLSGQICHQMSGFVTIVQPNSLPAQGGDPANKAFGWIFPDTRRVETWVQERNLASSEKVGMEKQSNSWWAASRRLNRTLKKQRLAATWAAQFWFKRCLCWCSFGLAYILGIVVLEL